MAESPALRPKRCSNPDCPTPPDEQTFYRRSGRCTACDKARARAWMDAHPEEWREIRRRSKQTYAARHPDKVKAEHERIAAKRKAQRAAKRNAQTRTATEKAKAKRKRRTAQQVYTANFRQRYGRGTRRVILSLAARTVEYADEEMRRVTPLDELKQLTPDTIIAFYAHCGYQPVKRTRSRVVYEKRIPA